MSDFLEKIQQKPTREKKRIVWLVSGGITVIIFLLWLSFFSVLHSSYTSATQETSAEDDVYSSFSILTDNVKKAFGSMKAQWGGVFGNDASTTPSR